MRLAEFILHNMENILKQWEAFARSVQPEGGAMDTLELRDHAEAMLKVIATDLGNPQTNQESVLKSKGDARRICRNDTAAESHADERLKAGFSMQLLVSEYRALRASVLRLWLNEKKKLTAEEAGDMIRFNEAIDQALAESVESFSNSVDESQDIFLGILGHDLRAPLQSMSIGAAYLMHVENIDSNLRQMGSRMYNSTRRMSDMLDDLLDYTKIRLGGGLDLALEQADLAQISAQIIAELAAANPDRIIRHIVSGDCTGSWDSRRVGQVYQNLISNALQYSSPGSAIDIVTQGGPDDVVLTVHNEGPNIPEAEQAGIFDPLQRGVAHSDDSAAAAKNLGLGLYIVKDVVAAHHGTISLTSVATKGTTFKVVLPKYSANKSGKFLSGNR